MRKPSVLESAPVTISAMPAFAWAAYRLGLGVVGLLWVCMATTLCGCNYGNAWMTNRSGMAYFRQGNYDAARFEFERALVNNPYRADYAYNVAKSMQMQGDTAGAEQMYQYALTLDPAHELSYHGLAEQLVQEGRQEDAARLVQAWADTQPYLPEANMELARWQQQSGDIASARQTMNRAISLNPHDPVMLSQMGYLYEQSNEPALAAAYYQQSLMLKPNQPEVKTRLSNVGWLPGDTPGLTMARRVSIMDPTMNGGVSLASGPGRQFGQTMGATGPMITHASSWQSPAMAMPMQSQMNYPMMGQPTMASPMMGQSSWGPQPMPQLSMPLNYETSGVGSPEMVTYNGSMPAGAMAGTTTYGPTMGGLSTSPMHMGAMPQATAYGPSMEQGTWTSTPTTVQYGTPGMPTMTSSPAGYPTGNYSAAFAPQMEMTSQPALPQPGVTPAMATQPASTYSPAPQMTTAPSVPAF